MNSIYLPLTDQTFKFCIDDYDGEDYVMHCWSQYEAEIFCEFLQENGRKWQGGYSYTGNSRWSMYKEKMCYRVNRGSYGGLDFYTRERDSMSIPNLRIFHFCDFLVNGDIEDYYYIHSEDEVLDFIEND